MRAYREDTEIVLSVNLAVAEKIQKFFCSELTDLIAGVALGNNHISEVVTIAELAEDLDGCIGGIYDEQAERDRFIAEAHAKAVVTKDNPLGIPLF